MKKCLFTLALLVLLACLVCAASAETSSDGWNYELLPSGLKITGYSGENAENLDIPYSVDGYTVTEIGKRAFYNRQDILSVTIPEGVNHIGAEAFLGTINLENIQFNARDCSVANVYTLDDKKGAGIFSGAGASSLNGLKVTFGPEVRKVPQDLFFTASMDGYKNYIDTNWKTGNDYAHITEVYFSDSVVEICRWSFVNCKDLKTIELGKNVETVGDYAFFACTGLTDLKISDSVITIGGSAFQACYDLQNIEWGNHLNSIGSYAFADTKVETVVLPAPLATIGKAAFYGCKSLKDITIPETVTRIEGEAFLGTINLENIQFNARDCSVANVYTLDDKKGAGIFSGAGASSLNGLKVTFGPEVRKVPQDLFFTASMDGYKNYIDTNWKTGNDYAHITEVYFSDSIVELGVWSFVNCRDLKTVVFGSSIESIGNFAFFACQQLTNVELPDTLVSIGESAFRACPALKDVSWGKVLSTVGKYAFGDSKLQAVVFTQPITVIGEGAFMNCRSLSSVYIPATVKEMGASVFSGDIALKTVYMPAANCKIGKDIFKDCTSMPITVYALPGTQIYDYAKSNKCRVVDISGSADISTVPMPELCADNENCTISGNGHNVIKTNLITEACTIDGVDIMLCASCGEFFGCEIYEAKGHVLGEAVVDLEPTCVESGLLHKDCVVCLERVYVESIPELGHTPEEIVASEATCTEDGFKYNECAVCGERISETVIPALGHDVAAEYDIEIAPDCETDGYKAKTCSRCGKLVDETVIPAPGHSFTGYMTMIKTASCSEPGLVGRVCTVCGAETDCMETDTLPHNLVSYLTIKGKRYGVCGTCNAIVPVTEEP